jgi:hypothetical protein
LRPVNLLPGRYRPARPSGERPGLAYAAVGALAVLLLMVLLYVLTNNGINDAKDKTAEAQAEQQAAQVRAGQLSAFANFGTLKTSRENAVKGIAGVRFDWERLMREMALLLPKDVFLTTFGAAPAGEATTAATGGATGTGPTVSIGGCAPSHPAVATTLVRLRKLHNAVSVDLTTSAKAATGAGGGAAGGAACKVAWEGTLVMSAERPPTTREPVPARLGGGQ